MTGPGRPELWPDEYTDDTTRIEQALARGLSPTEVADGLGVPLTRVEHVGHMMDVVAGVAPVRASMVRPRRVRSAA